jgi:endonuclease/exonuclease/phosphatase (EEP) superfamily protein YafD
MDEAWGTSTRKVAWWSAMLNQHVVTDLCYLFPGTDALRGHSMMIIMMIMMMRLMIMMMMIMMVMMRVMKLMMMQQKPEEFPSKTIAAYGNESQPYKIIENCTDVQRSKCSIPKEFPIKS